MRRGHYTLSDIKGGQEGIHAHPAVKDSVRFATCTMDMEKDPHRTRIKVISLYDIEIHQDWPKFRDDFYRHIDAVPYEYRTVCRLLAKAANGHGGRRQFAGRPKKDNRETHVHSLRCTNGEWAMVQKYLAGLRSRNPEI